jgi:dTDP-4-dehydrorhamnose 3,5-epimerase-like enzyme
MKITPIKPFNEDSRGYSCEYMQDRQGIQMMVFSKAGAVRGRHYHKGAVDAKNPEVVVLMSGICKINWKTTEEATLHTARIEAPARIEIPPLTWHEFIFETDSVMIEMNSLADHSADTFYNV